MDGKWLSDQVHLADATVAASWWFGFAGNREFYLGEGGDKPGEAQVKTGVKD